jgi:2-amino-4-hydroxy-6-hydroxymethyldihydropteridine diphosphokinase
MRAYLSIGSNLGDRKANLYNALSLIEARQDCRRIHESHIYETEPVGVANQPPFLNMAIEIETELAPLELLRALKEMEAELGRESRARWGPRLIDIDIVLCEDRVLETAELTIPHPEFRKRAFVLHPLAEFAGDAIDPVTGRSVRELTSACTDTSWIRVYDGAND